MPEAKRLKGPSAALLKALERVAIAIDDQVTPAQSLAFDALEANGVTARTSAAVRALKASPLSADAWSVLADAAPAGSDLELELRQQAVAAGRLTVGPLLLLGAVGQFWSIMESRPFMRALAALAECHWSRGDQPAALALAAEQLRLNPNDNQGARHILMGWLLTAGDDAAALALHERYVDDAFAEWPWALTLLRYRADPRGPAVAAALDAAVAANPHAAALLSGCRAPPKTLPFAYTLGSQDEAVFVFEQLGPAWAATPGAQAWLAAHPAAATQPERVAA